MATWIERQNIGITLTLGDGASYSPLWVNASKKRDFNIAEFVFKNVDGSLVKRGTSRGVQYNLEIIFQGADHLDVADAFDKSSVNAGAWSIAHPMYGNLWVQPQSLTFDNSKYNQTVITGTVIETLLDTAVAVPTSLPDMITGQVTAMSENVTVSYGERMVAPSLGTLNMLRSDIAQVFAAITRVMANVQADASGYLNYYNQVIALVNQVVFDGEEVAGALTQMMLAPALFTDSVIRRITMLQDAITIMDADVTEILNAYGVKTAQMKANYEANVALMVGAICLATVSGVTDDYDYRPDVMDVIGAVVDAYNSYVINLNSLQTSNGGVSDGYMPDTNSLNSLSQLVNSTCTMLYGVANNALQQRTKTLVYDSNLILEAYKIYGPDPEDVYKNQFIANNGISKEELLALKAGRQIIYYV